MEKYSKNKKCLTMSREQVRAFDSWAINKAKIPGVVLMENAGRSCAELIRDKLIAADNPKVCIFCGTGNNGGDGFVIARHLKNSGISVVVVICGERNKIKGDAKINLDIIEKLGQQVEQLAFDDNIAEQVKNFISGTHIIVDSIFGTGLVGQISSEYINLIESINSSGCSVLAVDIPSGLDCDTAETLGAAIKADYTVSFVAVKKGFTLTELAGKYTGEIYVASIGVEPCEVNTN